MNIFMSTFLLVVMSVMFIASAGGVEWGTEECGNYAVAGVTIGVIAGAFFSVVVNAQRRGRK